EKNHITPCSRRCIQRRCVHVSFATARVAGTSSEDAMNVMLRRFTLMLSAVLLLGACQNMGMAPMQQKSLYDRLGGQPAITALVEDLVKSLDKFKVPEKEKGELLGILGPMKPSIVGQ